MKKPSNCAHDEFSGSVEVGRLIDKRPTEFVVDVKVHCAECGLNFLFDEDRFAVSADRQTLRYKLRPSDLTVH